MAMLDLKFLVRRKVMIIEKDILLPISVENLLRMRPVGVVSKNSTLDLKRDLIIFD